MESLPTCCSLQSPLCSVHVAPEMEGKIFLFKYDLNHQKTIPEKDIRSQELCEFTLIPKLTETRKEYTMILNFHF